MDAMVALTILLTLALFLTGLTFTYTSSELAYQRLYYSGNDLLNLMGNIRVADLQASPSIQYYMQEGILGQADLNKSLLDVIGALWSSQNTSAAANITQDVFGAVLNGTGTGFELVLGNTSIWSNNVTGPAFVARLTSIASGYGIGEPVSGFVASAHLVRMSKVTSGYVYFGGYVGDGNITVTAGLPEDALVTQAYMELDAGSNFSLYVNGNAAGVYTPNATNMTASRWTVCIDEAACSYFSPGENRIELNFTQLDDNYIGGGFIRITYNTTKPYTLPLNFSNQTANLTERLPGIDGIVNLYSSFFVPGAISSISGFLHYYSNYTLFMTVGNTTVFESDASGEQAVNLTDGNFSALNYSDVSSRTVPLRIGLKNVTLETLVSGRDVDVVLITDLSGSMDWKLDSDEPGIERGCDDPGLNSSDTKRVSLAKCLDKEFIDMILNVSGNRVGLSGFYGDPGPPYKGRLISHDLSENRTSLEAQVEGYAVSGGTCICCAINDAYNILNEQSNASRNRFVVVMSDGIPTHACGASGDCEGDRTEGLWLGWGAGCYGGLEDCEGTDCQCAMQNANWSSCRVKADLNATVYSIGFGPVWDCTNANSTLRAIADCGGGTYHVSSDADALREIYQGVAEEIINASYRYQTVEVEGNISIGTVLYPDSWLAFEYSPNQTLGYGEVSITQESERFGGMVESPKAGAFYIPGNAAIIDARITSYSSMYWTDRLFVNSSRTSGWQSVYNLSIYDQPYTSLGDPYTVNIPAELLGTGENNSVQIDTGFSPDNATGGSPDDRAVYALGVQGMVGYGNVFASEVNATQDAAQRLQSMLQDFNISVIEARSDSQPISDIPSLWGPVRIEVRTWR